VIATVVARDGSHQHTQCPSQFICFPTYIGPQKLINAEYNTPSMTIKKTFSTDDYTIFKRSSTQHSIKWDVPKFVENKSNAKYSRGTVCIRE